MLARRVALLLAVVVVVVVEVVVVDVVVVVVVVEVVLGCGAAVVVKPSQPMSETPSVYLTAPWSSRPTTRTK